MVSEYLKVRVVPSDTNPGVKKISEDTYEVRVRAPACKGQANKEMLSRLSAVICGKNGAMGKRILLVSGMHKPCKVVRIVKD